MRGGSYLIVFILLNVRYEKSIVTIKLNKLFLLLRVKKIFLTSSEFYCFIKKQSTYLHNITAIKLYKRKLKLGFLSY